MVMIFAHPKAREQLLTKGVVTTFRKNRHKEGRDWATDKRCGQKIADIDVLEMRRAKTLLDLSGYADTSGFYDVIEWQEAIMKMHGENYTGWIYKVTKIAPSSIP